MLMLDIWLTRCGTPLEKISQQRRRWRVERFFCYSTPGFRAWIPKETRRSTYSQKKHQAIPEQSRILPMSRRSHPLWYDLQTKRKWLEPISEAWDIPLQTGMDKGVHSHLPLHHGRGNGTRLWWEVQTNKEDIPNVQLLGGVWFFGQHKDKIYQNGFGMLDSNVQRK